MKNCVHCYAEIHEKARYCTTCKKSQGMVGWFSNAAIVVPVVVAVLGSGVTLFNAAKTEFDRNATEENRQEIEVARQTIEQVRDNFYRAVVSDAFSMSLNSLQKVSDERWRAVKVWRNNVRHLETLSAHLSRAQEYITESGESDEIAESVRNFCATMKIWSNGGNPEIKYCALEQVEFSEDKDEDEQKHDELTSKIRTQISAICPSVQWSAKMDPNEIGNCLGKPRIQP